MSASSAAASGASKSKPRPNAALLQNSPLHMQLLLMMGSCQLAPEIMKEAEQVQRMLHSIMPEVDGVSAPVAPAAAAPAAAQSSAGASKNKKKKKKAAGGGAAADAAAAPSNGAASSASSAASTAAAASATAALDPSVPWSPSSLARLAASAAPADLLLQALLFDPASPHVHLRDTIRSMALYGLAAVKMPSAYACARLAHFYIAGFDPMAPGAGKDIAKGGKWLRMGAAKGHAVCQYQLAFLLEEGMLHPQSTPQVAESLVWYLKAAELKYPQAMFNAASILLASDGTHEGVSQDIYTAIRMMEDAAALGDARAQCKLGHLCFLGNAELEIEASMERCIAYLSMAAHNAHEPSVDAAKVLGIIYSTPDTDSVHNEHYNLRKAMQYLRLAAESGHADSIERLRLCAQQYAKEREARINDPRSAHERALALLAQQEGRPQVAKNPEAAAAAAAQEAEDAAALAAEEEEEEAAFAAAASAAPAPSSLTSTPSPTSLLLALTRVHYRYPHLGAPGLHAKLKEEYRSWELSLKRVRRVVKEQGWTAEDSAAGAGAAASNATSSIEAATPAIELAEASVAVAGRQRVGDVVNDLD